MEDIKAFTTYQETHLSDNYVNKKTFYEYQARQDMKIDELEKTAIKTLQSFKVILWIISAIALPMTFILLNVLVETIKAKY